MNATIRKGECYVKLEQALRSAYYSPLDKRRVPSQTDFHAHEFLNEIRSHGWEYRGDHSIAPQRKASMAVFEAENSVDPRRELYWGGRQHIGALVEALERSGFVYRG